MSVERRMGHLVLLMALCASSRASADPPEQCKTDEEIQNCLDGCEGLPARGQITRYEPAGKLVLHAVTRSGCYLVFPRGDERRCKVYPLGRVAAHAEGRFGAGTRVVAIQPPGCDGGDCTIALAVYGKGSRPLASVLTGESCDYSVKLRAIKLFPGRDSIEMVCQSSAGAGSIETRLLIDVAGDTLETLLNLHTGSYIAVSAEEKRGGQCPTQPVGWIRVEKAGAKPVLRVLDPASGELTNGKGAVPARQLAYDLDQRKFISTGAPDVPTKVNERACRR